MKNFIFKSASGLIKNDSCTSDDLMGGIKMVLKQNRALRQDLVDVKLMLNKLLIDKHLQHQVDKYFDDENPEDIPHEEDKEPD